MSDDRKPHQTLCRYYLLGTCYKGESCSFSHDSRLHSPASICKFYQTGDCKYGSYCMYSHVKIKKPKRTGGQKASQDCMLRSENLSSEGREPLNKTLNRLCEECDTSAVTYFIDDEMHDITKTILLSAKDSQRRSQASTVMFVNCKNCGVDVQTDRSHKEFLSHIASCKKKSSQDLVKKLILESSNKDCAICLENVISKEKPTDRSFGLLENCNHTFCLHCIRDWRGEISTFGTSVRSCPLCKIESYLVVPSYYFPPDEKEKEKIFMEYKAALRQLPCRYFNYGKSKCPFSTSCYYKHEFPNGSLVDRRILVANEDGELEVYNPYKEDESFVEFFENLNLAMGLED